MGCFPLFRLSQDVGTADGFHWICLGRGRFTLRNPRWILDPWVSHTITSPGAWHSTRSTSKGLACHMCPRFLLDRFGWDAHWQWLRANTISSNSWMALEDYQKGWLRGSRKCCGKTEGPTKRTEDWTVFDHETSAFPKRIRRASSNWTYITKPNSAHYQERGLHCNTRPAKAPQLHGLWIRCYRLSLKAFRFSALAPLEACWASPTASSQQPWRVSKS